MDDIRFGFDGPGLSPVASLAVLALVAVAVTFPMSLVWRLRRGRVRIAARMAFADALLVAAVLVILRATLPSAAPSAGPGAFTWMPFEDLIRAWPSAWARGVILGQMLANVALFVPLGLALTLRGRRVPLSRVVAASGALSIALEVLQGLAGSGRAADITDVLMNTAGGAIGWLLGRAVSQSIAIVSRARRS